MAEKISWLLAAFLCIGLPLALAYHGETLAGGVGVAVLVWLLRRDKLL